MTRSIAMVLGLSLLSLWLVDVACHTDALSEYGVTLALGYDWGANSISSVDSQTVQLNDTYTDQLEGYTVDDIWDEFDCETIVQHRPVHNDSTWMMLRKVYQGVVGPSQSSIPLSPRHGFAVNFVVQQSEGKGRGVFVTQAVQKGQLVYTGTPQTAEFTKGFLYRQYLQSIPQDLACDVMMWAYVEDLKGVKADNTEMYDRTICVDLDPGSLINDGEDEGNVGCDEEAAEFLPHGCFLNYFALRDIEPGEELLAIYDDFAVDDWSSFGL